MRVGGDGHAFQQAVRIALDHGPVHERPGVAFVGVADRGISVRLADLRANFHFVPVGNPPPPRPRRPLASTISQTCRASFP